MASAADRVRAALARALTPCQSYVGEALLIEFEALERRALRWLREVEAEEGDRGEGQEP